MKQHTTEFKNNLKKMGKQIDSIITYQQDNEEVILHNELYSITPHYETNLLKSVMKQLDIESSVDIPLETVLNYQFGLLVNNEYEYLDFGNYVVFKSEKQEDTKTYKITCYDKMLYAMKQNEDLDITYPISIKDYLFAIGNKIGLTVKNTNFANQNLTIPAELYLGLDYTYRDILDEIAQATGSNIIINSDDELEVKYFTNTNDTINEEYLKDINVDFGQRYGNINLLVLSRSADSDSIHYPSTIPENPIELKISDNQIMNFNNRDEFMPGIFDKISQFYYYINDFSSTGICYYDVCDLYNISIGENTYQCVMLNDEINITAGLEEHIYTDMPEQSQTDYSKADKTDRRINETYLIVDKQNQTIESVSKNVQEQNSKISKITQTVDELNSKIQDIADITVSGDTLIASLRLNSINQSEPISINIYPITRNISYMYPKNDLYPSDTLYMPNRILRFIRTYDDLGETKTENIDYELPDDLLYYDGDNYDEFILNYDSQTCQVRKKCQYNSDGTVSLLPSETVTDYPYPEILLGDGDYEIKILGYDIGYLAITLMAQNIYTTQFATKAELSSSITQTANEINLRVDEKLDEEDFTSANIILKINNDESMATIQADKIKLDGAVTANDNFKINLDGSIEARNGTFTGGKIKLAGTETDADFIVENQDPFWGHFKTSISPMTFDVSEISEEDLSQYYIYSGIKQSTSPDYALRKKAFLELYDEDSEYRSELSTDILRMSGGDNYTTVEAEGIITPKVTQTSKVSEKKNFEKLQNALDIIKNIDIYKYNLKTENEKTKKHIGFVIGEDYKYSKDITSNNNDGVDIYSFVSVCCKAIQEQQQQIEQLKKEIKELKGEEYE